MHTLYLASSFVLGWAALSLGFVVAFILVGIGFILWERVGKKAPNYSIILLVFTLILYLFTETATAFGKYIIHLF